MTDLSQDREKDKINPVVFYTSAGLILLFSLMTIFFSDFSAEWIGRTLNWVSKTFGWYYLLAATLYIVFVVCIACSRFGSVKLGPEQSKPEFSLLSWAAMLFAAGIGIDLMFFSVAEPVTQYMQPPEGAGQTMEAARQAMVWTLFHYGLTGWSMYALMGMALGYFSYRYNLPLTIRSALYPIFGKKINGPIGHSVDIAAVIGTIFGIATTLGIGVVQLNYGLSVLFDIPDSLAAKAALIALSVIIATISVTAGVDKGIRVLSELNVALALGLILFVLFVGDTSFLLNALVLNVGDYVNRFMGMTLNSFAFDRPVEWMNNWTLFFWAWWVAWSPFVGLFLARISRGRTIRQFVMGTLIIPFTFTLLWLSVFGNSALHEIIHGDAAFAQEAMAHPERGFYSLLAQYPAFTFSASVATITGLLFYVTSADSGALVLGNFTSKLKDINSDAPNWLRIFWSVAIGLLTLGMLMTNGDFRPAEHHGDHGSAVQLCDLLCDGRAVQIAQGGRLPSRQRQPRYRAAPAGCPGQTELEEASLAPDELPGHALHQPDDGDGLLPGNGRGGAGVAITRCLRGAEKPAAGRGRDPGAPGSAGAYGRRAELCLSDLAAAVFGARVYLPRAQRQIDLLPAGDLPAGR